MNALLESGPGSHPGSQVSPYIDENDFLNDLLGEPSSTSVAISLPGDKNNYEDDDFLDGLLNDNFEEFNIDINTQINSVSDVGLSGGGAWDDTFISSLLNTEIDNNNLIMTNENDIGNENENYFEDEKNKSNFNIHAPTASTQLTVTATDRVTLHKKIIVRKTEKSSTSQLYAQPVRAPGDAPYSGRLICPIAISK